MGYARIKGKFYEQANPSSKIITIKQKHKYKSLPKIRTPKTSIILPKILSALKDPMYAKIHKELLESINKLRLSKEDKLFLL